VKVGATAVELTVETLEEILTYLNGSDNSKAKIFQAPDDMSEADYAAFIGKESKYIGPECQIETPKENTNGPDGTEPVPA